MRRTRLFMVLVLILTVGAVGVSAIKAQSSCVNQVTVWDNETLSSIAARERVNVSELARVNNIQPGARLQIGQVLCLDGLAVAQPGTATTATATPSATRTATATATATATTTSAATNVTRTPAATATTAATARPLGFMRGQNATVPSGWQTYVVKPGENLFRISTSFGLTVRSVAAANNIANPSFVYSGETLLIPPSNVTPTPTATATTGTGTAAATATATATTTSATTNVTRTPAATAQPTQSGAIATPPNGQNTLPVINIDPVRLNLADAGTDTLTVSGTNYPPNSRIELFIEKPSFGLKSTVLGTVTSAADGTFSTTITIPKTWADGSAVNQYIVSVSGYAPGNYWGMNYFVNTDQP